MIICLVAITKISHDYLWKELYLHYQKTFVIGEGLVTSKGEKWKRHRKMLTQAFHFEVLKQYVHIYNEVCDKLLVRNYVTSVQNNVMIN